MDAPRMFSVGAPMYGVRESRPRTYRPVDSYADADEHARVGETRHSPHRSRTSKRNGDPRSTGASGRFLNFQSRSCFPDCENVPGLVSVILCQLDQFLQRGHTSVDTAIRNEGRSPPNPDVPRQRDMLRQFLICTGRIQALLELL